MSLLPTSDPSSAALKVLFCFTGQSFHFWTHLAWSLLYLKICRSLHSEPHLLLNQITGILYPSQYLELEYPPLFPQRNLSWPHQSKDTHIPNLIVQYFLQISNNHYLIPSACALLSVLPVKYLCKLWLHLEQSLTCRRSIIFVEWIDENYLQFNGNVLSREVTWSIIFLKKTLWLLRMNFRWVPPHP